MRHLTSVPKAAEEIAGILGQLDLTRPLVVRHNAYTRSELQWFAQQWELMGGQGPIIVVRDETDVMQPSNAVTVDEIGETVLRAVARAEGGRHWAERAAAGIHAAFVLLRRPAPDVAGKGVGG